MTEAKTDGVSIGEKSTISQNSGKSTTTLESLRAEVDSDVESEGHNTAYDRTYTLAAGEDYFNTMNIAFPALFLIHLMS